MEDEQRKIYCADHNEYRIYCHNSHKLAIDRKYNNHLKSQTLLNILRKRQQSNNTSS